MLSAMNRRGGRRGGRRGRGGRAPCSPPSPTSSEERWDGVGYCAASEDKFIEPEGPKPKCFCEDECILRVSGLFDTLWMRNWQCANTAYDASPDGYAVCIPCVCDGES